MARLTIIEDSGLTKQIYRKDRRAYEAIKNGDWQRELDKPGRGWLALIVETENHAIRICPTSEKDNPHFWDFVTKLMIYNIGS